MILGVILPLAVLAIISLSTPLEFGGVSWGDFTIRAYERVVFDRDWDGSLVLQQGYVSIFLRSTVMAFLATTGCVLFGFPTALFIATRAPMWRAILLVLVTIPFWTCVVVQMCGWIIVMADNGLLSRALSIFGLLRGPLALLYTDIATLIGLVYAFTPFMVLPIFAALDEFDWRLVEAAYDLGANKGGALLQVIVPGCRPGIMAGIGLVFVPALGSYAIPSLLGGNHAFMVGNLIDFQFAGGRDWPLGAAMSFVLLAVVLLAMLTLRLTSTLQRRELAHDLA
ncbi:ABC transporter permease [Burkholderia oklahomensis]|uniref:ABC transporter permease n=1 Tax=Burkholderia oklahomensis TaxID=342113 RepID=UPI00047438BC|nr:ABC transporter permease [Burkholderia oklahomensis]AOI44689.1 ABC transporter permease [Burkholderia oklahomensis C6786]KUY63378.1 ABC transporter permease [Burkholderia oklahomensis C6786]MBI0359303.1 ABC transporter permease [Burkholderia oklahomensis]